MVPGRGASGISLDLWSRAPLGDHEKMWGPRGPKSGTGVLPYDKNIGPAAHISLSAPRLPEHVENPGHPQELSGQVGAITDKIDERGFEWDDFVLCKMCVCFGKGWVLSRSLIFFVSVIFGSSSPAHT